MWYAIILAGGSGSRMGAACNKVFLKVAGESVLGRSVKAISRHVDGIVLVTRPQERAEALSLLPQLQVPLLTSDAGEDRQESVYNGLTMLPNTCSHVLIHDAARCLVDDKTIECVKSGVLQTGAAVAAIPVTDTIKSVNNDEIVTGTPERSTLRAVQTPQGFNVDLIMQAHRQANSDGFRGTDDASLV